MEKQEREGETDDSQHNTTIRVEDVNLLVIQSYHRDDAQLSRLRNPSCDQHRAPSGQNDTRSEGEITPNVGAAEV